MRRKQNIILYFPTMKKLAYSIVAKLRRLKNNKFVVRDPKMSEFADGSPTSAIPNVRGAEVTVVADMQGEHPSIAFMRLAEILDALERAGVAAVTVVMPYHSFSRSDRKAKGRESIMVARIATFLKTYNTLKRIITIDLHSDQIEGMYTGISVTHLSGSLIFAPKCRPMAKKSKDPLVTIAGDVGGARRTRNTARLTGGHTVMMIMDKTRPKKNEAEIMGILCDRKVVKGLQAVICDDVVDTAGTLVGVIKEAKKMRLRATTVMATHGVLSPSKGTTAISKLRASGVTKIVLSDTIPLSAAKKAEAGALIEVVSCADLLASTLHAITTPNGSVSRLYDNARAAAKRA